MPVFGLLIIMYFILLFPVFGFAAAPAQYDLQEGDLISAEGDPDIYIINEHGFKRLFVNPAIFGFYGHLGGWENVKTITTQTRDAFPTSLYFKNCETNDTKVYAVEVSGEDTGVLHWLNASAEKVVGEDANFSRKIFCINDKEFRWYTISGDYSSISQVSAYSRGAPIAATPTRTTEKRLIRLADDPKIYYLAENGVKKHIISPEVFSAYEANRWEDVVVIDKTELDSYPTSNLVRKAGSAEVYRLEAGKKRLIPDAEVFNKLGLDWSKVISINEVEFNAYPTGSTLTVPQEPIVEPDITVKKQPQDTTPPLVLGITISNLTESTASISWTTNEPAEGQIEFGTSPCPCANNSPLVSSLITTHVIDLFTLIANTTYHYKIKSKDAAGNLTTSTTQTFKTAAAPPPQDILPPVRSATSPSGALPAGTIQATISFSTNESAICRYSTTPGTAYDSMTNIFTGTGGVSHSTSIPGLTNGTSYAYYTRCKDVLGNKNTSDYPISFSVASPPAAPQDTTAPARSSASPTGTLAYNTSSPVAMSLATNEAADCRYETTPGVAFDSMFLSFSPLASTSHSATVRIVVGNSYSHYVKCQDAAGNKNTDDFLIQFSVENIPPPVDTTPPQLSNAQPTGTLSAGTTQTTLSLLTNENATCRYATSFGVSYDSMANVFTTTGALSHSSSISGLTNGTSYSYYVKCQDASGNKNTSDFSISFSVAAPPPPPATPVPILVLKYLPDENGDGNLDLQITGMSDSVSSARSKVDQLTTDVMVSLENASAYHGYKDASAAAYLDYSIVGSKEYLTRIPLSGNLAWGKPDAYRPDYYNILNNLNVCDYVDVRGVRQIWIWGYHTDPSQSAASAPYTEPDESNMAMGTKSISFWNYGPSYGDVSNSQRINDMPTCENSYVLYNYNYSRGLAEAIHNHGHQIEHVLNWADGRIEQFDWGSLTYNSGYSQQDWSQLLFWGKFVGSDKSHKIINPGCGWIHIPPNTSSDYNYADSNAMSSDCENWKPDGTGAKEQISCNAWGCTVDPQRDFIVWWMQNLPGRDNNLIYQDRALKNWWEFYGHFDNAVSKSKRLTL